ncbi:MAG: RsbRD N-terminal domain-containing protein [Acidobacteriota bacterium]
MTVNELLRERRGAVIERWGDAILATYPADGARFFKRERDPFHNPVGSTIVKAIGPVYDWVLGAVGEDELASSLDAIVRIRSVQSFTPGQAVGFVFALKAIITEEVAPGAQEAEHRELSNLFMRIDQLALRAFDVYAACRQRVADVRINEVKARTYSLLRRAGAVDAGDDPDADRGPDGAPVEGGREA